MRCKANRLGRGSAPHLKHLSSALTVTGGDQRRVDINETSGLEEGVGGMCKGIANTGNSPYQVGSGAKVQPLAQALHALSLLAEWVFALAIVTFAQPHDLVGFQLHFLQHKGTLRV